MNLDCLFPPPTTTRKLPSFTIPNMYLGAVIGGILSQAPSEKLECGERWRKPAAWMWPWLSSPPNTYRVLVLSSKAAHALETAVGSGGSGIHSLRLTMSIPTELRTVRSADLPPTAMMLPLLCATTAQLRRWSIIGHTPAKKFLLPSLRSLHLPVSV